MKKLLGAVLPLLLVISGTSCAFEGAVTTTAHTGTPPAATIAAETTTTTTTAAATTAATTVTTAAAPLEATEYQTLSMGFGLYTMDIPADMGKFTAESNPLVEQGTRYSNSDGTVKIQTGYAAREENSGEFYIAFGIEDGYPISEEITLTQGDVKLRYRMASDSRECYLWVYADDPYMAYAVGVEMPLEYEDTLETMAKSFTVNEKLRERYVNKQIARGGNLWMAWDNSIALSAADDWTAAAEPINSRHQLALAWHEGDQLIMINHAPAGEYQYDNMLKENLVTLAKNAGKSMGLSDSQSPWSEVWEEKLSGVRNVPVYYTLRTAASSDQPHVLYAAFIYQGELFECVFMTMPWVEQEQLDEWTDMLFGISTCP